MTREPNLHAGLTYRIIGAVQQVYRTLGAGFLEKVYGNALALELSTLGLRVETEVPIKVYYRDQVVGFFEADVLVEALVILELKAVEQLVEIHEVQLVNYLRATEIELGLLVNFGPNLEIRRRILTNDRKKRS